ncbi:hypothetical protein CEK29_10355 [Bordetella genomosp. 5]|uniref:Lipoprotein n=1 Tax=Bordetella genomosp. 5 TaxID=1395608 RepID=A0A261TU42_9BORD|nr:hypothetical protein [Bordetella genomosp. 5]OZI43547.1 hypothetical protein CEK29_10355 [Bordetella genomosp. 5]OZI52791.1 hypothetical protein CAL25_08580 [Bordetella genomosp. 5]
MRGSSLFVARLVLALTGLVALSGCISLDTQRARLIPVADLDSRGQIAVSREVTATLSGGAVQTIASGSQWRRVGAIVQGDVYRPLDRGFTLQGARQVEAWLVIARARLVGFYLPGEQAFAPLKTPVALPVEMRQ